MRILSAAPSNTEIIYALGLQKDLIGTTSLCNYPDEAVKKPSIGGWSNGLRHDKVDDLNPDIILLSDALQDEQASRLRENHEVLQVNPNNLEEVFESILRIGKRFRKKPEAVEIISEMRNEIEEVDLGDKRIYCEEWMEPSMVSGNWIPSLVENAGGNYFIDSGRSREFDLEKLKAFDPEYIFLNVCGAGKNVDAGKVLDRPEWQEITAVKNEDVFVIDDALLNRPSPRIVKGLKNIKSKLEI